MAGELPDEKGEENMNANGAAESITQDAGVPDARLPQIDPATFSALSMLDGFVAKALLTRQEHAEASKGMQHVAQTIEQLQAALRELRIENGELRKAIGNGGMLPIPGNTVGGEESLRKTRLNARPA